jgi:hypothetical protein
MSLQDLGKKIVGFLNFTFNAFMYVSSSYMEIDSKNVVNDIVGIVRRSILLSSSENSFLISIKQVFSNYGINFQVILVQEFVFLP